MAANCMTFYDADSFPVLTLWVREGETLEDLRRDLPNRLPAAVWGDIEGYAVEEETRPTEP